MSEDKKMIYFKNDILSDIKNLENNMNTKINQINNLIRANSEEYNLKFTKISNVISELIEIVSNRKHDNEKIEELLKMKDIIWSHINDNKNKLISITKDVEDAIFKYDRIILDNLELPGIVGKKCKYKTMRDFFEYIFSEIKADKSYREQQNLGNQKYKERIETLINSLQLRSNEIFKVSNEICSEKLKQFEIIVNTRCETTETLIHKARVENSEYATELKSKVDKINIAWDKLEKLRNDINKKISDELKKFKNIVDKNNRIFNENKNEFKLIKQRFTQLSEFIRDIRFQKNLINQRHSLFSKEAKNIDFRKSQIFKNENDENRSINDDKKDNDSFSFINYEKNDYDIIKDNNESFRKNNSFNSSGKKMKKNNKIYDKIINPKKEINLEINGKKIKKTKKNKILIKKEIELIFLAENNNDSSISSTISNKIENTPNTERTENKQKKLIFKSIMNNSNINNNDYNNEELKLKNKLRLQSVELMNIENHKKNNNIPSENNQNKESINNKYLRNNKTYKTVSIISNFNINSYRNKNILNSNKNNKLLLTEINLNNKETNISKDIENNALFLKTQNFKDNKIYEYANKKRHSSIVRKLSFFNKDNDLPNFSNKKLNFKDKISIKINDNINNLFSKVNSLQDKYNGLTNKIDDLFNIIKKINNQIVEVQFSKFYVDNNDENIFKKRKNALSVKLKKNNNNNNYNKKFNSSYKNKLPNDEANIILRRIEPFLIKEFKKKKNY